MIDVPQLISQLDKGRQALMECRTNMERLEVRDRARAIEAAAEVLNRKDIQTHASILVARAERMVAKATPARKPSETGRGHKLPNPDGEIIHPSTLYEIRKTHDPVSDERFEVLCKQAEKEEIPLTRAKVKGGTVHQQNTGDGEWYTPRDIIESARDTMGGIDLDPCTSEFANTVIRATTWYDEKQDGLKQAWSGKVWMNPPFKASLCRPFCERLIMEPTVEQAIVLVQSVVDTDWAQGLLESANVLCFPRGRLQYWRPDSTSRGALFGHIIYGIRVDVQRFTREFETYGVVR